MGYNQVFMNREVKLDLTADTVSEDNLLVGATAHNSAGDPITGAVLTVPVDSELSEISENAIQNKVVAKNIKGGETLSGSTGYTVNDSLEYQIIGLRIFGRCTQNGMPISDNPFEIMSVVEPTVSVLGKNLAKYIFNYAYTSVQNGVVTATSIDTAKDYRLTVETVKDGIWLTNIGYATNPDKGRYSYRFNKNSSFDKIRIRHNGSSKDIGFYIDVSDLKEGEYTVSFDVLGNNIADYLQWGNTQIEVGTTDTEYESYTSHTLSFPDILNGIPVSSGGNVTIDGQEYIADYKDFGEGKCHRLVDPDKLDPNVSIVDNLDLLLETEEITDIPEAEMQAFKQLQTYNGTTNIINDKGAGIEVKYCTNKALSECVAPITKNMQKQIDDLKAAVLSLGGNV